MFCLQEILQWFYLLALIEQIWCNMVYLTKACSCFHVLFYLYSRNGLMSHVSSVVSFSSIGNSQWIRDFAGTNLLSKGISLTLSFMENYFFFFANNMFIRSAIIWYILDDVAISEWKKKKKKASQIRMMCKVVSWHSLSKSRCLSIHWDFSIHDTLISRFTMQILS